MFKKRYGIPGALFAFIIFKYVDERAGDLLGYLHKLMAKPFSLSFLQYKEKMSPALSTGQFILLFSIYSLIFFGIVFLITAPFKKAKNIFENYEDIEEKLGDALLSLEKQDVERVIDVKITSYMTAIEWEVKRIFNVRKKQIDFIWYFPKRVNQVVTDDYELIYLKNPKDLHHAKFYIDSSLNIEGIRLKEENVKGRWETPNAKFSQFITARNVGKPRLGLAVYIYKENVINEENEQEFAHFTTNLLLLGLYDPFVKSIEKRVI
ncbi:hypothetical protein [Neobacillus vireti]|uniref:Uncharacterized protein n=1 Tax=Neobacillus vireti LMG 21834 TaxID=1131730 RepID=A0AB94ILH4_9BACI|nr:hypothetical protein [Neobacillus vireti]ETI67870.1 hypothetical protein BAVI_15316 [Neobacillus vireti LMG 21834]KLT17297.1 hypothetical protein AA980_15580 [Neobacillus vireti]